MKNILFILFTTVFISCNNDVKIVESENKKECRRLLTCFTYHSLANELVGRDADLIDGQITYPAPYIDKELNQYRNLYDKMNLLNKDNISIANKAKSYLLKNYSKSKVYKVRIQREGKNSIVTYKDYVLEPTREVCIGCDTDFDIDLKMKEETIQYFGYDYERTEKYMEYEGKVKHTYDVKYKISKIEEISEY